MLKADQATVVWDVEKKHWTVRVTVGEEVIKRSLPKLAEDASDETLRSAAVTDAVDEGYEVSPASVVISR